MLLFSNWLNHYCLRTSTSPLMSGKDFKKCVQVKFWFILYSILFSCLPIYYMRVICAHVWVCVCMWRPGSTLGIFPYHSPVYGFGIGSFFDRELISCLEWSANELQGSACLYLSSTPSPHQNSGATDVHHCSHPLPGCWGSERRSLCLPSKHFTVNLLVFLD